jgi:hypothetical protein
MNEVDCPPAPRPADNVAVREAVMLEPSSGAAVHGGLSTSAEVEDTVSLPSDVEDWIDLYRRRFPRTRPNGGRALRALYELLEDPPADGFTVRDVAALAGVGLDTVARVVHHLRWLGVLTVDGGGWVAEPGGRPGHGVRYRYITHWPPRDVSLPRVATHDRR